MEKLLKRKPAFPGRFKNWNEYFRYIMDRPKKWMQFEKLCYEDEHGMSIAVDLTDIMVNAMDELEEERQRIKKVCSRNRKAKNLIKPFFIRSKTAIGHKAKQYFYLQGYKTEDAILLVSKYVLVNTHEAIFLKIPYGNLVKVYKNYMLFHDQFGLKFSTLKLVFDKINISI